MAEIDENTIAANAASPKYRSMIMSRPAPIDDRGLKLSSAFSQKGSSAGLPNSQEKIEKLFLFGPRSNWLVDDRVLRPVPPYYPLEKSSRFITGTKAYLITSRISDSCRVMSIQANFNHDASTAVLMTPEHVEIYIVLWRGTSPKYPECVIVEAQRRWGDAVTYHKYCHFILDAAEGVFDAGEFQATEEREKEYSKITEEISVTQKHVKGPAGLESVSVPSDHENSLLVLEIAASLLKKDRMDARQLGMESLCLLTDPTRAGIHTALIASRAVLTGSAQDESCDDEFVPEELGIREAILSLVQFGRLEEDAEYMDEMESDDEESANRHPEEQEHSDRFHNLALAVLANSLNVLENHGSKIVVVSGDGSSAASVADTFLSESKEISSRDLLATLLNSLEFAGQKPHDALLSARCLGSLCEASKDARRRAKEMNAKNVVATALDVGRRTHLKLQTASEKVLTTLEKVDNEREDVLLPTKRRERCKSNSETSTRHPPPSLCSQGWRSQSNSPDGRSFVRIRTA